MRRRRKLSRIDFDEVISDSLSESDAKRVERQISPVAFYAVFLSVVLVAIVFVGRTAILAGANHERYVKRAEANVNQSISLIAPRGIITDRNGTPLVENKVIFSVFLNVNEMVRRKEGDAVIDAAVSLLGAEREEVRRNILDTNLESVADLILARDVTREQVIAVEALNLTSLTVESDYEREYLDPAFSHVVGYVGLVNRDDLWENDDLVINDLIGRAGLEGFYDGSLRGENGAVTISQNAVGNVEEITRTREPIAGESIETTIDAEFQKYFYSRILQGLTALGRTSGVGIAIDPKNGEVIALASFPSYDANNVGEYLENPNQPLFNRAVAGVYSPGSTIKPIHAAAALKEGVVTPSDQVYSAGYIEIPNPYFPDQPSRFLDWKPHGWVDVYSALARSSNVYFYTIGGGFEEKNGLGIDRLNEYWKHFNFDKPTGIDLPGESVGFLPTPDEKEKRTGQIWRVGDTYNVSIGQGDLQLTPIGLLNAMAAIANDGTAFSPHIKKGGAPDVAVDVAWLGSALSDVERGMREAVIKDYGTAHLLSSVPVAVAAKTGSAQIAGNTKTNALFVGYAPVGDPKIAILILVEDAREGSLNAVPIARDIFQWYYENRIK